eukprot:CAMPEP_0176305588 /NCGR_PEP_ID=MMETSP0121_2-20121125/63035_1 /TAXON_ID=160619 /ORGANISM="Kryptoperidinium foliaceum, Strain CCMP 1326" /LENGTH=61 /DNA_ID=CAMNT_0017647253 /DNA_START=354 /DNA_END=539 /DNA_ORIENTATION=-
MNVQAQEGESKEHSPQADISRSHATLQGIVADEAAPSPARDPCATSKRSAGGHEPRSVAMA